MQKEVKIKKANAKKCAAMVQKFFKDKELNALRAEKAREANLRKIALTMSREVKGFWGNAQKLFEWRVKQKLERKRKEALDQHLNFIVDKTEKYSTLLAESLAESASGQVRSCRFNFFDRVFYFFLMLDRNVSNVAYVCFA